MDNRRISPKIFLNHIHSTKSVNASPSLNKKESKNIPTRLTQTRAAAFISSHGLKVLFYDDRICFLHFLCEMECHVAHFFYSCIYAMPIVHAAGVKINYLHRYVQCTYVLGFIYHGLHQNNRLLFISFFQFIVYRQ